MAADGHLGTVTVTAIVLLAVLGGVTAQQTIGNPVNSGPSCDPALNYTLSEKYVKLGDSACADALYKAFSITDKAQCPPTQLGSQVHLCMNKNNTGGYANAWATLVSGCEYMYIANRRGQSESETGFTYKDDSCFPRFDSWSAFNDWLRDARPYQTTNGNGNGVGDGGNAAGIARIAVGTVVAALMFAFMMLLQ